MRNPYFLAARFRNSAGPMRNSSDKRISNMREEFDYSCNECGKSASFVSKAFDEECSLQPDSYWCAAHKKHDSTIIADEK